MAPLRARVLAWLESHDEGDVEQIARDVTARTADVRDTLRLLAGDGLVVVASRGTDPRAMRQVYMVAPKAPDGLGRPSGNLAGALAALSGRAQPTQGDQILSLLADGTTWSSRDLHRLVFCVLHSRIAELRRRLRPLGFDIEHSGGGSGTDVHWYQLVVSPLKEVSVARQPAPADTSLSGGGAAGGLAVAQLQLDEAA